MQVSKEKESLEKGLKMGYYFNNIEQANHFTEILARVYYDIKLAHFADDEELNDELQEQVGFFKMGAMAAMNFEEDDELFERVDDELKFSVAQDEAARLARMRFNEVRYGEVSHRYAAEKYSWGGYDFPQQHSGWLRLYMVPLSEI